jgi:hypothetical protein
MKTVSTGLVVFAGLMAAPAATPAEGNTTSLPEDTRLVRLQQYFADKACPATRFAQDFIAAADLNSLDWRLLPSIAIVESGGGKAYRNNNILGWGNGNLRFNSIREGIHEVARMLATSPLYRDKTVDGILHTFNPEHSDYVPKVKAIMQQIAHTEIATAFN